MIRRDFLQAEIAKLAQALAKILGLKEAGKKQEAVFAANKSLLEDFDLEIDKLLLLDDDQFKQLLNTKNYPAQKLNMLSQFLLENASPFEAKSETFTTLNHILTIYNKLEQEHRTQSLENLNQQQNIVQFLKQND